MKITFNKCKVQVVTLENYSDQYVKQSWTASFLRKGEENTLDIPDISIIFD